MRRRRSRRRGRSTRYPACWILRAEAVAALRLDPLSAPCPPGAREHQRWGFHCSLFFRSLVRLVAHIRPEVQRVPMTLVKWIFIAAAGYRAFAALMYVVQRSLMYFPETVRTAPAAAGLPQAQEVVLDTADGEKVIVWHVPPRGDGPVVIYFHGNGGSLRLRVDRFQRIAAAGVGLVALSYRGYGGSTGKPTEDGPDRTMRARPTRSPPNAIRDAHRAVGRVARHRRRGRARRREAGHPHGARCAVHLDARRRGARTIGSCRCGC